MKKSVILNIILAGFGLVTVLPFIWMLGSSFKTNIDINAQVQYFWPRELNFENYKVVLSRFNFLQYFWNSIVYAVVITVVTAYTSSLSGFVLAKYNFKWKNFLFSIIMMTMMVPGVVTIIPRYSIMRGFGWLDSFRGLVIPSAFTAFGIFLVRQACFLIPDEMLEAARADGATEFYIFHRIVLPQLHNSIVSIAIFQFLWAWDDYLWPYLVINSEHKQVLSVALNMFSGRYSTDYAGLFAATSIAIIPVIVVYIIFQKKFIAGISSAALKG